MYKYVFKRCFDILFAFVGLVILIPFFIVISVLIYLDDKGPVFYNGERLGYKGSIFKMFKFRTMYVNAPDIRNADGSTYNSKDDPRVTRIGGILRKTSVDELPQLLNVLIGNMSFIGPRPGTTDTDYHTNPDEQQRRSVRPGITGYSQALMRNSDTMDERMKNDIYYVEHISLKMDIFILLKTFQVVLGTDNIYRN